MHPAWKTIAYGAASPKGKKFCAISPHKGWVNLQFHSGGCLEDPDGLLEGSGTSMRHVKVATSSDARSRKLAALVRKAARTAGA